VSIYLKHSRVFWNAPLREKNVIPAARL